jgi:hypothetical protein
MVIVQEVYVKDILGDRSVDVEPVIEETLVPDRV